VFQDPERFLAVLGFVVLDLKRLGEREGSRFLALADLPFLFVRLLVGHPTWIAALKGAPFPVFGFPGGWNLALGRGKRRLPEKKLRSEDRDLGVCDMMSPIQEPKWKSWLKRLGVDSCDSLGRHDQPLCK
jgi:hypothetical protein